MHGGCRTAQHLSLSSAVSCGWQAHISYHSVFQEMDQAHHLPNQTPQSRISLKVEKELDQRIADARGPGPVAAVCLPTLTLTEACSANETMPPNTISWKMPATRTKASPKPSQAPFPQGGFVKCGAESLRTQHLRFQDCTSCHSAFMTLH